MPLFTEADVAVVLVLAIGDGVGGTYVLVGFEMEAELVDRSEVRLVDLVAETLAQYRFEYTDAGASVFIRQLSLASMSHLDPRYNISVLQRQLLRLVGTLLYAELHEVIDFVRLSHSNAISLQNA